MKNYYMPLKTGIMDLLPKFVLGRICQLRELYCIKIYAWMYATWKMNYGDLIAVNNVTLFLRSASQQRTLPHIRRNKLKDQNTLLCLERINFYLCAVDTLYFQHD